jgi:Excalibur calcium-binding domain
VISSSRSCGALHRRYPHGVGLPTAVDRAPAGRRVTGFGRSSALYAANRALDRDGDHIACERR